MGEECVVYCLLLSLLLRSGLPTNGWIPPVAREADARAGSLGCGSGNSCVSVADANVKLLCSSIRWRRPLYYAGIL